MSGRRPVLGVVTIGQTPRPDLAGAFGEAAPHAEILVAGALDDLAPEAVARLEVPGPYPLLVRLADGRSAEVPLETLRPRVEACARRLAAAGAGLVVVACAGGFPEVTCAVPVLRPGLIVPAVVRAIAGGARIGVVTPNRGQVTAAEAKWRADGFDAHVTFAAPGAADELPAAAARMREAAPALVILDCMGHDETSREAMARHCGRPVIAARSLVARVAGALI